MQNIPEHEELYYHKQAEERDEAIAKRILEKRAVYKLADELGLSAKNYRCLKRLVYKTTTRKRKPKGDAMVIKDNNNRFTRGAK